MTREEKLTHPDWYVRVDAINRGRLTTAQRERALTDVDWRVRYNAVRRGGLTKEQHERALKDEDWSVSQAARTATVKDTTR